MNEMNRMEVPDWFRNEMSVGLVHQVQQTDSDLEPFMTRMNGAAGKAFSWDLIDPVEAHEETHNRLGQTIAEEVTGMRRWVYPNLVRKAVLKDINDDVFLGRQSLSLADIQLEIKYAFARKKDDIIIRNAYGVNRAGENGEIPVVLLDSQTLAVDYASSGSRTESALTLDKLTTVREIFEENRVINANLTSQGEKVIGLVSPNQKKQLLDMQGLTNSQLAEVKSLNEGSTPMALGIHWVVTPNVPRDAAGNDQCLFYVQSGLAFVPWGDIQATVDRRLDMNYATQIWTQQSFGVARTDEKKFVLVMAKRNR